ncbi:14318_t:CDS:10 [Funneliformis mosseae]|uniref:14318_t:CDS:1 n=1 Tax=Funneliformis mosseae TaxID=27381 RepID=A0A9N8WC70_FUNMO|nr:14318_t:CDS:10 [Funneliformis mosseae]
MTHAPEIREQVQQVLRNFWINIFYLGYTVIDYPAGCVLAVEKVTCLLERLRACWLVYGIGRLSCGLRAYRERLRAYPSVNLQIKQQNIHMNLKLVEEKRELLEKEQDELKDWICLEQIKYEPKRIRRESNTYYSQVMTESQQSATLYLTLLMTEVTEYSSINLDLGSLDRSKNNSIYVCDDSSSCESMPCPSPTRSVTNTLIRMPNKSIITKATYNEYSSAHIISAFNLTIHLVKATIREQIYSKIESKIILETKINDNQMTDEDRFIFFIRYALLDFVSKFMMPKVLDPFSDVKYMWIEKNVRSIKEANIMFTSNFGKRKTDLLILRLSDAREFLNVEVSGPPYRSMKKHTVGDVKKLLMIAISDKRKYLALFVEQEKLQRKIRSFIPGGDCTENLRDWLHLPDDDILLVTGEDMNENISLI